MERWLSRYEEGYTNADGSTVKLTDELHERSRWDSPEDAMREWSSREDLSNSDVARYQNGLQQTDDVRNRPEFAGLGVVAIWRRVSFERARVPDKNA